MSETSLPIASGRTCSNCGQHIPYGFSHLCRADNVDFRLADHERRIAALEAELLRLGERIAALERETTK